MCKQLSNFDKALLDSLKDLDEATFQRWQYFENRAENLQDNLWTTGTWLITVLTAALTLPFVSELITITTGNIPLCIAVKLPVFLIALFGLSFSAYAFFVLREIKAHIETNWRKSDYLRTKIISDAIRFKKSGWYLIAGLIGLECIAFSIMITAPFIPALVCNSI